MVLRRAGNVDSRSAQCSIRNNHFVNVSLIFFAFASPSVFTAWMTSANDATVPAEHEALLDLLMNSIVVGDVDTIRNECYAADATIWHNYDQINQTAEQNLKSVGWIRKLMPDLRYENTRRQPTSDGVVQQHNLRGTARNGDPVDIPACIVFHLGGTPLRVQSLEEYVDTAQAAAMMAG
jgi:hypothetical protein